MNEADWLACADPRLLQQFLGCKAGDRKLRLFACACVRRMWNLISDERSRRSVEVAEAFSDSLCAEGDLTIARNEARAVIKAAYPVGPESNDPDQWRGYYVTVAPRDVAREQAPSAAENASAAATYAVGGNSGDPRARNARKHQAVIFRDIFGNPFHSVTLVSSVRTPTVVSLARAAYDERRLPSGELDPQRMAVLANALEEVGAPDEVVAHLRGSGPHVRGCFSVDLCLGLS